MVSCIDPKCNQQFSSVQEAAAHVEDRRAYGDGHLYCVECTLTFDNVKQHVRHNTQWHLKEQHVPCPGCDHIFPHLGAFLQHIELNICPKVTTELMDALRQKRFPHSDKIIKTSLPKGIPGPSQDHSQGSQDMMAAYTSSSSESDKADTSCHGQHFGAEVDDEDDGSSDSDKTVTPSTYKSHGDAGASTGRTAATATKHQKSVLLNSFYCKHLDKFLCHHDQCWLKFDTEGGLVAHLCAPLNQHQRSIRCPWCKRIFGSAVMWVYHLEGQNNCNLKLHMQTSEVCTLATAGLVEVNLSKVNPDGTTTFEVSSWARDIFNDVSYEAGGAAREGGRSD